MVINGDNCNIGTNGNCDDPLERIMIHWSYNGGNVDDNTNDNIGSNGNNGVNGENDSISDIGNIGTNGSSGVIEWRCVFQMAMCDVPSIAY